ncbi:MAG: YggU family protein [Lentisphaeria bacterium]|nr:YggU family protein [Lentisphaeria bacterium]
MEKLQKTTPLNSFLTYDEAKAICRISCYIQPKSSRNSVVGLHDGKLKIALTAPPVDGQANAMLIKFLASYLDKPKRDLEIVSGDSSRNKIVAIKNINPDDLAELNVNLSQN